MPPAWSGSMPGTLNRAQHVTLHHPLLQVPALSPRAYTSQRDPSWGAELQKPLWHEEHGINGQQSSSTSQACMQALHAMVLQTQGRNLQYL